MKKILCFLLCIGSGFLSNLALAAPKSLMDCYKLALMNDPTFKAAREQWMADKESIPIARADLLPQINFRSSADRTDNQLDSRLAIRTNEYYNNKLIYNLKLSQPIFNCAAWAALWGAKASAKASAARFNYSAQDLIVRLATAYFNVLQAKDVLFFTQAEKKAIGEQLLQTKRKYDVGLVPITDVREAQASYDTVVSSEITAKKDLADRKEELREITGPNHPCEYLDVLNVNFPLIKPNPYNIGAWVRTAVLQNYLLLAAQYDTLNAKDNIKVQGAGHLPTLDLNAGYDYDYNSADNNANAYTRYKTSSLGLSVNVPILNGGKVVASTNQAEYLYQKAVASQEYTYRNVMSNTRQAYFGVISGIESIRAHKQEVLSKVSSLRSTRLSYEAGLRTILDVLNAERDLYNSKKNLAIAEYYYINQTLLLKEYAGTLSVNDLQEINNWLVKIHWANGRYSSKHAANVKVKTKTKKNKHKVVNRKEQKTKTKTQHSVSKNEHHVVKSKHVGSNTDRSVIKKHKTAHFKARPGAHKIRPTHTGMSLQKRI